MKISRTILIRAAIFGVIGGAVVIALVAARPFVEPIVVHWWNGEKKTGPAAEEKDTSHVLVRGPDNRPVRPYVMRLAPETVKSLKVTTGEVKPAGTLLLPSQIGTLGYDTDRLYPVRPRFAAEIISIREVTDYLGPLAAVEERVRKRLLGPGDYVKKGDVLAVAWSKEIADRKVALVSALLDLYLDEKNLERILKVQEESGAVPPVTVRGAQNKVEKDQATVYSAESSLGIARLTPQEIEEVRSEARVIQKRLLGKPETPEQREKRIQEDVRRWAKVELVAPHDGFVVEKNTNVNDIVDPSKDTPLFRIADLTSLMINVNFNEEYLPVLQPLMKNEKAEQVENINPPLRWKVRVEAMPDVPVLDLPVLRIAPSLDPTQHTATVIGRLANPVKDRNFQDRHLLVGQFVTATVQIPPGANLVEIPTNALNEVGGESLVFVQRDKDRPEYELRRIVVVRRSREVCLVRGKLTANDEKASEEEVKIGRRSLNTVRAGEWVVTQGVTEMTEALEGLIAKSRAEH
jgi:membrane fusion protein, heavy metal efflux system